MGRMKHGNPCRISATSPWKTCLGFLDVVSRRMEITLHLQTWSVDIYNLACKVVEVVRARTSETLCVLPSYLTPFHSLVSLGP